LKKIILASLGCGFLLGIIAKTFYGFDFKRSKNLRRGSIGDKARASEYLVIALQYYLAGRSACFANSVPVAGNLLHHAVEMLLKYFLLNSYSPDELKYKFQHQLKKLWNKFKSGMNDGTLRRFDGIISDLQDFDELRYPEKGFLIIISIFKGKRPKSSVKKAKQYFLYLEEIDELFSAILTGRVSTVLIRGLLTPDALAQYQKDNKHLLF